MNTKSILFSSKGYLNKNHKTFKYFQENTYALLSNNPINAIRIKALEFLAESELFSRFIKTGKITILTTVSYHNKVNEEIIPNIIDLLKNSLESYFRDFMISAGMYIANINGEKKDNETEENMYTKALQVN
jgi:hypothetical protein